MSYALLVLLAMIPVDARASEGDGPVAWSPDGKWLAYAVGPRDLDRALRTGWIFGPTAAQADDVAARSSPASGSMARLWATRRDGGTSVLIDESDGFPLAPSWSPDGRALAFGRMGERSRTIEVVIWEGRSRRRVIAELPLPDVTADPQKIAGEVIAWSPDGRHLAVPTPTAGLAILRVEDGTRVNTVPGGRLPAWSPDGGQLACFVSGQAGETLVYLDSALSRPKVLLEVGRGTRSPAWTRDGILTVVSGEAKPSLSRFGRPVPTVDLVRVRVEPGQVELIQSLGSDPNHLPSGPIEGVSFAVDREGDDLFWALTGPAREHHIVWFRPREGLVRNRMPILDPALPIVSMALSPSGDALAVRFGSLGRMSPPILFAYDSRGQDLTLLAPDDDARSAWLAILVGSARSALLGRTSNAPATLRPTLLPYPGELEPTGEVTQGIRRVARLGRWLCDRPAEPVLSARIDEARLFFDALREDFPAAQADLEALELRVETPDHRLALLGLRAQLALGRSDFDHADQTIAYLRSVVTRPGRRLEWVGDVPILTTDAGPSPDWVGTLEARSALLREVARTATPLAEVVQGHFNPDAMPGQGLEPFAPRPQEALLGLPDDPRPGPRREITRPASPDAVARPTGPPKRSAPRPLP